MNTIALILNRAMKSPRRILIAARNSSVFVSPPAKSYNSLKPRFNHDQNFFGLPSSNISPLSMTFSLIPTNRYVCAFKVRNFSTSVETRVNENNFERIYVQGGMSSVKSLVVESVDKDDDGGENVAGEKNLNVSKEEESEVEKQAWKLLEGAVVNYCGNPVGTMAANDPGDKLPLNYDQVFIRDFVPSALAFLLRGESEIVKNFLLHTLQLQVIYPFKIQSCVF